MKLLRRLLATALFGALAVGCQKSPALDDDTVVFSIESSPAFQEVDPSTVFPGGKFQPSGDTKREMVSVEKPTFKDNGPFGMAGKTADVIFTWRWTGGPYAGSLFKSRARFNSSSGTWKLYPDLLREQLWKAERRETD